MWDFVLDEGAIDIENARLTGVKMLRDGTMQMWDEQLRNAVRKEMDARV
jgi:hypothetical protein